MRFPKLRFSEFKQDWAFYKFSDITEILRCGIASTPIYVDEGVPFLSAQNVTGDGQVSLHKYSLISEEFYKKISKNNELKKGDLLYSRVGAGYGKAALFNLDGDYGVYVSLTHIRPTNTVDPEYLKQYLNSPYGNAQAKNGVVQGGGVPNLNVKTVEKFLIPLPSLKEQEKIGGFLKSLDQKIALLNDECKCLVKYKKGVMQKIFSQEIRFKNDVGGQHPDWETKSLGDIGTFQTSSIDKLTKDNERKVFLVNYMNVYRHENINNHSVKSYQIVSAKDSQIQSCNLKMGDILFTPSSETPDDIGHSVVISEDLDGAVYSYHLMRFRPKIKIDIKYSHYFCNTQNVLAQLTRLATGATRFTISIKSFSTIQVQLPCIEEQQKIASLFIKLDEKISNVQKQLELTKQYKQGLLQQMFV